MYIIIVGGGKVGYYLAKELLAEPQHEVLIIEQDAAKCERGAQALGDTARRAAACDAHDSRIQPPPAIANAARLTTPTRPAKSS